MAKLNNELQLMSFALKRLFCGEMAYAPQVNLNYHLPPLLRFQFAHSDRIRFKFKLPAMETDTCASITK